MRKILFTVVVALCTTAQATILRVSNRTNSGAPYTDINSAITAAEDGDTIMIDGSTKSYGDVRVTKRVVLIGPGFLLNDNGIIDEGSPSAQVGAVNTNYTAAAGSILMGLDIRGIVTLSNPNIVITRCRIAYNVTINSSATNCVIHQNYIIDSRVQGGSTSNYTTGAQITNNIFTRRSDDTGNIYSFSESYIAYNTMTGTTSNINYGQANNLTGCTVENNIFYRLNNISGNSYSNNLVLVDGLGEVFADASTDKAVKEITESHAEEFAGKGAFAGTDPYVVSGIPAGPYISDITVPASVEQGQTLRINVNLGVQQ